MKRVSNSIPAGWHSTHFSYTRLILVCRRNIAYVDVYAGENCCTLRNLVFYWGEETLEVLGYISSFRPANSTSEMALDLQPFRAAGVIAREIKWVTSMEHPQLPIILST